MTRPTQQPIQPEETKVKTSHSITYKGHNVSIVGEHEFRFARQSKMRFSVSMTMEGCYSRHVTTIGTKSKTKLKNIIECLIDRCIEDKRQYAKRLSFKSLHTGLSTKELIAHENFAYARFRNSGLGDYYTIYWKSPVSPTGVESVGGCNVEEWEAISKQTGNSHNYLSPTEDLRSGK